MIDRFKITVQRKYYDDLESGKKKCEGKKQSPTYVGLKINDVFPIVCEETNRYFMAKIVDIHYYNPNPLNDMHCPLRDYLLTEGIENCLPRVQSLEDAVAEYLQFWTERDVKKYGVMAIFITKI